MTQPDSDLIYPQLVLIANHIPTTYFIAVISVDGFSVASWIKRYAELKGVKVLQEENPYAPMNAAMFSIGDRVLAEMQGGNYGFGILQGDKGTIYQIVLSADYVLSFGVRELRTLDEPLIILKQWWGGLLGLMDLDAPEL